MPEVMDKTEGLPEPTVEQLQKTLAEASLKGDWKRVSETARRLVGAEKKVEDAKREAAMALVGDKTRLVKAEIDKVIVRLKERNVFDSEVLAGVWYTYDFGSTESGCRLTKGAPKAARAKGEKNTGYVSRPERTEDLLREHGSKAMFKADEAVTIDKTNYTMKAGMTYAEAHKFSTNGGWRNKVRQALLKEANLI